MPGANNRYSDLSKSMTEYIISKWNSSRDNDDIAREVKANIGVDETGPVELDLHAGADGPHMLVAGTTGSGKTETIITFLIGLCMNYSPDDLNLLLIDMKGGAFTKWLGDLPHVVGKITDIDGDEYGMGLEYMFRRFLYAMNAEITRRKRLFRDQDVDNIDDYIRLYHEEKRRRKASGRNLYGKIEPLPHLVLVVDEFTELKRFSSQSSDVDFMAEITTIARVGRSLGFHIILISQNIEGAITDDIRVNSNARICHKVATAQASKEMIGSELAYSASMPSTGRAYLVSGNGKRYVYFQAGYSKQVIDKEMPVTIELVRKSGTSIEFYNSASDTGYDMFGRELKRENSSDNDVSQLDVVVDSINKAFSRNKLDYKVSMVYQGPLSDKLNYEDIYDSKERIGLLSDGRMIIGRYDDPANQKQPVSTYDYLRENMLVCGSASSGKTTLVKSLLLQNHLSSVQDRIYLIDFGGNIGAYKNLNRMIGCADSTNEESVKRIFRAVESEYNRNAKVLGADNFYERFGQKKSGLPAHVTLIIENLSAFLEDDRYSTYHEQLLRICRDGISKGVSVIATTKDLHGVGRIQMYFGCRIALDTPDDITTDLLGEKTIRPIRRPGRGLIRNGQSVFELQVCRFQENSEKELLKKYSTKIPEGRIEEFRDENFRVTAATLKTEKGKLIIGKEYYDQAFVSLDISEHNNRCIGIYGKRNFGKTNLLNLILMQIEKNDPGKYQFYLLDDGRKQLDSEHLGPFLRSVKNREKVSYYASDRKTRRSRNDDDKASVLNDILSSHREHSVIVIQGREYYSSSRIEDIMMINSVEEELNNDRDSILIFSDIPRIPETYFANTISSWLQSAFLLDDIGDFIVDRGRNSVFSEMDAKELKLQFARCSIGDGYYYDVVSEDLKKIKIFSVS